MSEQVDKRGCGTNNAISLSLFINDFPFTQFTYYPTGGFYLIRIILVRHTSYNEDDLEAPLTRRCQGHEPADQVITNKLLDIL
jgi:hypothetical protein